jgi:hypothetical protein
MPCVPGITLPPGDRGESAKPRLSGWLLEVALRGSSLEEKVWRITLGTWERSEESSQELVAADRGLRTSLEVEELHTTTIRHRIPPPRCRLLHRYSEFESTTIPPSQSIHIFAGQEEGSRSNKAAVLYSSINGCCLRRWRTCRHPEKIESSRLLVTPPSFGFCHGIYNGRIGSFGTLYKVLRAEKREYEVYATLLLSLYTLDTVEASILLAMGSAYLNLH